MKELIICCMKCGEKKPLATKRFACFMVTFTYKILLFVSLIDGMVRTHEESLYMDLLMRKICYIIYINIYKIC